MVELAVVEKKEVVVALVPVAFRKKRLVDDAVVAKKLVVVAEVPVALTKVKFWSVVAPLTASVPE